MGTITKALDLLNEFSPTRAEIGLVEMARLTGRAKATVHRHLTELEANGFLEQNPATRAYRLGAALLRLAALREHSFPTSRLLRPLITKLAEDVGELVHASLLQAENLSPLIHYDPQVHGTQVHFDQSEVLPLHATASGLAVMAFLPEEKQERILSRPLAIFTNKTQTDPDHLRHLLTDIAQAGICIADGSFDPKVASIGAPVFDETGRVAGAVAIAAPRGRAKTTRLESLAQKLVGLAQNASQTLGGQYPNFPDSTDRIPQISAAPSNVGE